MAEHFDVLIVGAGLSGIGAAWHLQQRCPDKTYAILEGRDAIGGTWDLFRYPGIRSDSDMYTLGYSFRPWREAKAIADGPSILNYVRATANEGGIQQHIRFRHRVVRSDWSSSDARWTVTTERKQDDGANVTTTFTCNFLFVCAGYYRYENGYMPDFPGLASFGGKLVHPQAWPEDLDYADKRVVVIGSGATAVTIVPEMARTAKHVTMLQRSPTYVVSRPAEDKMANWLRRNLPAKLAYSIVRWRNVLMGMYIFRMARKRPEKMRAFILDQVRKELGPDYDVDRHFSPKYNPWDQRMCLVPDGDLFNAIKDKRASVVTDTIEAIDTTGVKLSSGQHLDADIIVSATGLELQFMGGMAVTVDGKAADPQSMLTYKGMMYSDVPNLATAFGYTNASWTLKCDLTCEYVCRLINYMDRHGYHSATPKVSDKDIKPAPWMDFTSGYVQRGIDRFPRQGEHKPWRLHQNYALDLLNLRYSAVTDGEMTFA
ncbi:MAG: NAD(P)-binding protein [Alphaproteobacteria bacterium]|nr:NAD(P)-binding protein [Alphaproteobacteria bacterium]